MKKNITATICKQFLCIGILLLILAGSFMFFVSTNTGLRFLATGIAHTIPGTLAINKITGSLSKGAICEGISYKNKMLPLNLNIGRLEFTLKPRALLQNTIHISSLQVDHIELQYFAANKISTNAITKSSSLAKILPSLHLPSFPVNFQIDKCTLQSLAWYYTKAAHNKPINIDKVNCAATIASGQIKNLELKAIAKNAFIAVYKKANEYQWQLHVPNLQTLAPYYKGGIESYGDMAILKDTLLLKNFVTTATNLAIGDLTVKQFNGKISTNFLHANTIFISLYAKKLSLRTPQFSIPQLAITGEYRTPKGHPSNLILSIKDSIFVPQLGISLHAINLSIQNSANNNFRYQANLASLQGALHLQGKAGELNKNLFLKGKIYGDNFLIINTKEYNMLFSPQLVFQATPTSLELTGDVFIDKATIAPQTFKSSTSLPPETTFAHQQDFLNKIDLPSLKSRIKLILGDAVNINIMGIKGALTGKILVIDDPQKPTTATGKFMLNHGSYDLYGQSLKVHEGTIIFNGGIITNPELDIKASRKIKNAIIPPMQNTNGSSASLNVLSTFGTEPRTLDLTVGLNIHGYVDNLKTTLFSEPAGVISPTDILSFLMLGQSSAETSGDKTQLLLKAATTLNFGGTASGFNKITSELQHKLGLSELTVGAENLVTTTTKDGVPANKVMTNTALMLGKYLSPKLYLSYSIGLIEPINIFRIRYHLSHGWSLQSESSSNGNGADILYTVERK